MSKNFEGLSANGSIEEAIADAIGKAKQELTTDLIEWKLVEISGENGGFVGANKLKVCISANSPSGKN
jgi:flavin-binding protein dodecin